MTDQDPTLMVAIILFFTTTMFAISTVREHQAEQEALTLALRNQQDVERLNASLDHCVQDKAYAAQVRSGTHHRWQRAERTELSE